MAVSSDQMPKSADEIAEKVFASGLGMIETLAVYVGDRMGWYRALADGGPATPAELVERAGGDERYAREWLEQQAVSGYLEVEGDGSERRFDIPAGVAEVMTDESSLAFLAPLARMLTASAVQIPSLMNAYKNGGGVGWADFGDDARESQADMNRPWLEKELPAALAGLDEVHAILSRPGARIADVGYGGGWSTIALARAYPDATVEGFDIDEPSAQMARANAEGAGMADRVTFHAVDAAEMGDAEFDAVFAFECIHDMPYPIQVLSAARKAVKPDGVVIVMDEAVGDEFMAPGDDTEKLMYGFSLFLCLPDGRNHPNSAMTGTVMRPRTLKKYATEAGFSDVSVLPIEEFGFWRFYLLHI